MTKLLELRERLCGFYGKYDIYIRPAIRFVIAITAFLIINSQIGYMSKLKSPVVAIALAAVCTFLPMGTTVLLAAVLVLIHLLALSMEAFTVAFLLFLLMFFMYFKFAPKNGYQLVLTPLLCQLRVVEIMPTAIGLCKEPYSVLATLCGLITFYFLKGIRANEVLLSAVDSEVEVSKFTIVLQQLVENKELYLMAAAFVLTTIIVYVIRRQGIDYAWTIAIGVGNAVNLAVLLIGSFLLDMTENILWRVVGVIAAILVGLVMEFFMFHLDYSRTERVQFQDDEYYYYVKAVPKVYVSTRKKQVKQINRKKGDGISKKQLAEEFDIDQDLLDV